MGCILPRELNMTEEEPRCYNHSPILDHWLRYHDHFVQCAQGRNVCSSKKVDQTEIQVSTFLVTYLDYLYTQLVVQHVLVFESSQLHLQLRLPSSQLLVHLPQS